MVLHTLPVSLSKLDCNFSNNVEQSSADSVLLQPGGASTSTSREPSISADHDSIVLATQESEVSSSQSQSLASQESVLDVTLELLRANAAFEMLQQSPIPSWKAEHGHWISKKIDRVCGTLKEKLGCHDEPPDKVALNEVIAGLKRKYRDDDTTRTEKIPISYNEA